MSTTLVERARSGEADAWRELYRSHAGRLVVWLQSLESSDATSGAEDLAAETWLVAAEKIHDFDGSDDDFAGWLFGVARNLALNARRRAARRRTDPHEPTDAGFDRPAPEHQGPGTLDGVRALLDRLPERERAVVACLEVVGLDVASTAQALEMSATAVRVARHRGLARLRKTGALDGAARS